MADMTRDEAVKVIEHAATVLVADGEPILAENLIAAIAALQAQGEPVAEVGPAWSLVWVGSAPLSEVLRNHPEVRIGTKLYAHPPAAKPDAVADRVRQREADRARFPDPGFNNWLDEGISDAGHTVWDAIGSIEDAWSGWGARRYYEAKQPDAVAGLVEKAIAAMRGKRNLWRCDLVGDQISVERMREILTAAFAAALAQREVGNG